MNKTLAMIAAACLSGCASHSSDIQATYVSPAKYEDYTCHQLTQEILRMNRIANRLAGNIDDDAKNDQIATGVGLVIFWPALFFLGGDEDKESEFSMMQGKVNAIEEASILKNCGFEQAKPSQQKDSVREEQKNT